MNKADFIKMVAEKAEMSQADVKKAMEALETVMAEEIFAKEDSVRLGLGTFSGVTKETAARAGRNPFTGESLTIPAKTYKGYPKVKFSKLVKPDAE